MPDVAPWADRLAAITAHVGVGVTTRATADALARLLTDLDAAIATADTATAHELSWFAASGHGALALARVHLGDPAAAADLYRQAAARWHAVGELRHADDCTLAAAEQAVAAGGSLDVAIRAITADLADGPAGPGLRRARLLASLARLTANIGDRYEARRHLTEAATILTALGYPDPASDAPSAIEQWQRTGDTAASDPVQLLQALYDVITTWEVLLGVRGAIGDGWAEDGIAAVRDFSRRVTATVTGGAATDASWSLIDLEARLGTLRSEYDTGPTVPDPAAWSAQLAATRDVGTRAIAAGQPLMAAEAAALESDLLTWNGRADEASAVLAAARVALAAAGPIAAGKVGDQLFQLIRRQVEIAAGAEDSAAVSRFAGEAIALVEADRTRLSLPYLQDSFLRDRRMVYAAGMAAARRLGDLELMLERADLVKARGALAWLPGPVAGVAEIRAGLAEDEVVVYHLWAAPTVLYILTLDRHEIVCDRRVLTDAQRADLDSLVADFAGLTDQAVWPDTAIPALGPLLLPTDGARLLQGKRHLILSPNGILHQLPLQTLTWQGGALIDSFAISYVPNLAALSPRPVGPAGPAFVLGISTFPSPLDPIAAAVPEAQAVAALHADADLLLGDDATVAAVRARIDDGRLDRAGLLHLATHGDDGPITDPLAARFLLVDGQVIGTAMTSWRLSADLVVLSACWSGQRAVVARDGTEMFGDEVYGLQSAFFAAGARQVLGATWFADDATTGPLMAAFHSALAAGTPADVALQQATLGVRATRPLLYHWSPFKLTAMGRPAPGAGATTAPSATT